MLDPQDPWARVSALKASLPFAMALPTLVAIVFAACADWVERYLTGPQPLPDEEKPTCAWAWQRRLDRASPGKWRAFSGRGRNQKRV